MSGTMAWMLAALVGELVLLLLVLLTVSWARNRAARRRDAKAMQALVGRIRDSKAEREATLTRVLSENFGLEGDALGATASALLRHEITVLQRFVGIYGSRDAGAAALFDADVATAIAPYHGLAGEPGSTAAVANDDRIDPAQFKALQQENKRLSDELRITMETMSRMLNEYSTMFSGAPADGAAPIGATMGAPDEALGSDGADADPAPAVAMAVAEETADDDMISVVVDDAEPDTETTPPQSGESGQEVAPGAEASPVAGASSQQQEVSDLTHADALSSEDGRLKADDRGVDAGAAEPEIDIVVAPTEPESTPLPHEGTGENERRADAGGEPGEDEPALAGITGLDPVDEEPPVLAANEETDRIAASEERSAEVLFEEALGEDATALQDKGADIEVMSELLVEGESALLAADGSDIGADSQPSPLFDAEDGGLFDDIDDKPAAPVGDADVLTEDEIDSLFDADEPAHAGAEKFNQG